MLLILCNFSDSILTNVVETFVWLRYSNVQYFIIMFQKRNWNWNYWRKLLRKECIILRSIITSRGTRNRWVPTSILKCAGIYTLRHRLNKEIFQKHSKSKWLSFPRKHLVIFLNNFTKDPARWRKRKEIWRAYMGRARNFSNSLGFYIGNINYEEFIISYIFLHIWEL